MLQPDAPKNPRAVAEAILAALPETGMVAETSLAGAQREWDQYSLTRCQIVVCLGRMAWWPRPAWQVRSSLPGALGVPGGCVCAGAARLQPVAGRFCLCTGRPAPDAPIMSGHQITSMPCSWCRRPRLHQHTPTHWHFFLSNFLIQSAAFTDAPCPAGPGFINIRIDSSWLAQHVTQ